MIIENVAREDVGDDAKQKPVIYFRGKEKGLVCNATNYDMIADAYGDETDDWPGQPIELYPTRVQFKGQLTDAIRVRIPQAKPAPEPKPAPTPAPAPDASEQLNDDIPW